MPVETVSSIQHFVMICSTTCFRNRVPGCNYPGTRTRFQVLSKKGKRQCNDTYTPITEYFLPSYVYFAYKQVRNVFVISHAYRSITKTLILVPERKISRKIQPNTNATSYSWVHHAIPTDSVPTDAIPTVHSRDVDIGWLTAVE